MNLLISTRNHAKKGIAIPPPLYACCVLLWKRPPSLIICASSYSFSSRSSIGTQKLLVPSYYRSAGTTWCISTTAIHCAAAIPGDSYVSPLSSCPYCHDGKRSGGTTKGNRGNLLRISYLTDIEGDGAYLDRYVSQSKVLAFAKPTEDDYYTKPFYDRHIVFQDTPNDDEDDDYNTIQTMLIFGGDATDKGGSDLYVLRQLLSLQRRYGSERVKLILGNRDINKMRIWQELLHFSNHNHVYWDSSPLPNKSPHRTLVDKLKWMLSKTMGSPDAFQLRREELSKLKKHPVSEEEVVLSYIQSTTPCGAESIQDNTAAFDNTQGNKLDYNNGPGLMTTYLCNAKVQCKVGSVLFLHGALPPPLFAIPHNCTTIANKNDLLRNYFDYAMPWKDYTSTANISHLQDWIDATNHFAATQISSWNNLTSIDVYRQTLWSSKGGYYNDPAFVPGSSLLQYGMSSIPCNAATNSYPNNTIRNPTVVYNTWPFLNAMSNDGEKNDNETAMRWLLSQFYHKFGIQAIVTGHKPQGDLPLPIQIRPIPENNNMIDDYDHSTNGTPYSSSSSKSASLWVLSCDTSYSGDTIWIDDQRQKSAGRGSSKSGRGDVAVSEVLIDQCIYCNRLLRLQSHGILSDGSTYQSPNLVYDSELIGLPFDNDQLEIINCTKEKIHNHLNTLSCNETDLNWWVKTKLDENHYLISASRGFHVWNGIARRKYRGNGG